MNNYTIIVGMGATGLSVARYLAAQKIPFIVYDTRNNTKLGEKFLQLFPDVELYFGDWDESLIDNAREVIVSPGVSVKEAVIQSAQARNLPVRGDIEVFLTHNDRPVIGITGSNGKSTLTTLVGKTLEEAGYKVGVGGNIGIPALDLLEHGYDVYVLELSSFQLEVVAVPELDVACLLNVSEDHMDRYDSFEDYKQAKYKIFRGARKLVFCTDDENTYPPNDASMDRMGFGIHPRTEKPFYSYHFDKTDGFIKYEDRSIVHKEEIALKGTHNVSNALALLSIARQFGIKEHSCVDVLRDFPGLPHRCEFVGNYNNVTYINDSKATNVGAALAAIEGLKDDYSEITLIAGGDGKGSSFEDFGRVINQNVTNLVLIGKDGPAISSFIDEHVRVQFAAEMKEAVAKAKSVAKENGVILLSPACASLDMFTNFEERGALFVSAMKEVNK